MAERTAQETRKEKGEALYWEGAVEPIEEHLQERVSDFCEPGIGGGIYSVRGSRGDYTVSFENPVLGVQSAVCDCEDYRRREKMCKHGYAVAKKVWVSNQRKTLTLKIKREQEALATGKKGGFTKEYSRKVIEKAARELAELEKPEERRATEREEPVKKSGYERPAHLPEGHFDL